VLDSSGTRVTGGTLTGVTASGQPGAVSTSAGGALTHYGGFLGCITLLPGLDTDSDGLSDEIDPDNDNDNLTDLEEVGGGGFVPNTVTDLNNPDSDADGASDGDEAVAMTNPQDSTAFLAVTEVAIGLSAEAMVTWSARDGLSYNLFGLDDLNAPGTSTLIANVTAAGGAAPWFETTAMADDVLTGGADSRTYFVEVAP